MSYFAEIVENKVVNVIVAESDFSDLLNGEWVETFIDGSQRYNYAGIGYTYDAIDDAFIAPMPCNHDELVLNQQKQWECSNASHVIINEF